jgi:hypothetical protein
LRAAQGLLVSQRREQRWGTITRVETDIQPRPKTSTTGLCELPHHEHR